MEHCSYELSVQLRDSGFPQPEPAAGQVWYSGAHKTPFIIIFDKEALDKRYREHGYHAKNRERGNFEGLVRISALNDGSVGDFDIKGFVYAPTALDILKELGLEWELSQVKRFPELDLVLWKLVEPFGGGDRPLVFYAQDLFEVLYQAFVYVKTGDANHASVPIGVIDEEKLKELKKRHT